MFLKTVCVEVENITFLSVLEQFSFIILMDMTLLNAKDICKILWLLFFWNQKVIFSWHNVVTKKALHQETVWPQWYLF